VSPGANGADESGGEFPIRSADRRERVDEWALVLAAEGLHPRVTRVERGNLLWVPGNEAELAERVLGEWERENPPRPPTPRPAAPIAGPASWRVAVLVSTALLGFFRVTGPSRGHGEWFEVGASDADLILAGEWWRVVTALTLHADLAHVLGNCLAGAFFLTALGRSLGPGLALGLTVAAGALGNLANALLHAGDHSSVGASTAVFGAVGLLAGLGVGSLRREGTPARRIWLPIGAGLALVAMLGTGARVDIWAHVLGVVCGAMLGVVAGSGRSWRPGPWIQWLVGMAAIAVVVASWSWGWEAAALQSSGGDALVSAVDAPQTTTSSARPRGIGVGDESAPPGTTARSTQHARAAASRSGRPSRRLRRARRRVKRALLSPVRTLAGWIVPPLYRAYLALVWRTSRIQDLGVAGVEEIRAAHAGVVTLLWHEEIVTAPYAYRRLGFRPHTLASVSDSGQLVTRVLESCGYRVFRGGSSRRRSRRRHTVLMEMAAHMRERTDVIYGITVDGSHGPAYQMKWGGVVIARQTGRPIVLVRTWTRRNLRLRSWDRLAIPLPWNEIRLSMRGPYPVPADADTPEGFARFCARLEADLRSLAAESYEAFGQPLPRALREARDEKTR
jgi:rhomboid protease GluP